MEQMQISVKDLMFLMEAERIASESPKHGYVGAYKTEKEFSALLDAKVVVSTEAVEGALFSALRITDAGNKLEHRDGISLGLLVKRITPPGYEFDEDFTCFIRKRSNNK